MNKLPICRVCLAGNVSMYVVPNSNLRELYEKLTDNLFVTGDSRPMLACSFCCTKLKQCYQFQRKCLEAEQLFAQMMNEGYERIPLIIQDHQDFSNELTQTPVQLISIDGECQTENITIKEELPVVCEGLDDTVEGKEDHHSDVCCLKALRIWFPFLRLLEVLFAPPAVQLEREKKIILRCAAVLPQSWMVNVARIPLIIQEHQDFSNELTQTPVQLISIDGECQTENITIKEELPVVCEGLDDTVEGKEDHHSDGLELRNQENSFLDVEDNIPEHHHSESDSDDDVPLMGFKIEVEEHEVLRNKREASDAQRSPAVKKQKLEDVITEEQAAKTEQTKTNVVRTDDNYTLNTVANFKDPLADSNPGDSNFNSNTNCRNNTKIKCKKSNKVIVSGHRRLCVKEKSSTCEMCNLCNNKSVSKHKCTHTVEKLCKCEVCERCFSNKSALRKHMCTHTGEKPYQCEVCQRCFSNKSALARHIRTHTGEKAYKCEVCQKSFSKKSALPGHIRTHTGEKPYKCEVCQQSFSLQDNLKRHTIRAHTGEKLYKCGVCQRFFMDKAQSTSHIRTTTGEKPFKYVCQRCVIKKCDLSSNIPTHTDETSYKCEVCQRIFAEKCCLRRHIRKHAGEKPFKCDICQRCFSDKSNLKSHIRSHTGEKPYKCDICQSRFSQKWRLTSHIRKHTGEKPFKCGFCQRCFRVQDKLTCHIRTHTGDKPHKCDICQRRFVQKCNLKKHVRRIHTGEKPFKCDVCQRCFSEKSSLKDHIRTHTGEKPYECDICQRRFSQKRSLKYHACIHAGE